MVSHFLEWAGLKDSCSLTEWLRDWLNDWLVEWLTDWLTPHETIMRGDHSEHPYINKISVHEYKLPILEKKLAVRNFEILISYIKWYMYILVYACQSL